jgi:glutamyl/glutaminyl-tRNA synthetase
MEITHVIRAEEWLSSTPKHLILYEMFGWEAPKFAHLPMILGPDHKKLSKRHGATSVSDYQAEGYLSEALINFMAFLGWNPKDDSRQYFTLQELIGEFKITNVNKSAAVFDIEKLKHINEYYLRTYGPKNLRARE